MKYLVNQSPWPVLVAFNVGCSALNLISVNHFIPTLLPLVLTLLFWARDFYLESKAGTYGELVYRSLGIAFGLFLATEFLYFVALFWCSISNILMPTLTSWPSSFIDAPQSSLPILATLLLLGSSVSATASHHLHEAGMEFRSRAMWVLTMVLGLIFLPTTFLEFYTSSFTMSDGVYGSIFYMIIGTHLLHVIVGLLMLLLSRPGSSRIYALYYWHFVDFIWLIVLVLSYEPFLLLCITLGGPRESWDVDYPNPKFKDQTFDHLLDKMYLWESDREQRRLMILMFLFILVSALLIDSRMKLDWFEYVRQNYLYQIRDIGFRKKALDLLILTCIEINYHNYSYALLTNYIRGKMFDLLNYRPNKKTPIVHEIPLGRHNLLAFFSYCCLDKKFHLDPIGELLRGDLDNDMFSIRIFFKTVNLKLGIHADRWIDTMDRCTKLRYPTASIRSWPKSMVILRSIDSIHDNKTCYLKACEVGHRAMSLRPYLYHMSARPDFWDRKLALSLRIFTSVQWIENVLANCYIYGKNLWLDDNQEVVVKRSAWGVFRPGPVRVYNTAILAYWSKSKLWLIYLPNASQTEWRFDCERVYHRYPLSEYMLSPYSENPITLSVKKVFLNS